MENNNISSLPQTQEEQLLYEMWREVLGIDDFDIDDDFFEIGGNSMLALDIISRLGDRYEVDLKEVFETATIRAIASGMKLNPGWAEEKLSFIFQEHEKVIPNKKEIRQYRKRFRKERVKRNRTSRYSSVLLLGATGFLGAYLLRVLLEKTDCSVSVIVRAENNAQAANRIQELQCFYFGSVPRQISRLSCYAGDLTKENFGLSDADWMELSETVDAVLNSAAMVKHMGKNNDFRGTNVGIVQALLSFAENGRKKDIHHVSSIGILFGEQPDSESTVFTEYDFDVGQKLDNNYLKSKFAAEEILFQARENGINTDIYRLNGVMFDSRYGVFQKNIGESSAYIFIRALNTLKIMPKVGAYDVDISMVDQIAEAIIRLLLYSGKKNQVYHVIHPQRINFEKMLKKLVRNDSSFVCMNAEQICEYYRSNIENEKIRAAFGEIMLNCEIFESIMKNRYLIRQDKTVSELKSVGFRWKRVRASHFKRAYDYVMQTGFLSDENDNMPKK